MGDVTRVSIGQVKRDISELVNRVVFGGERIVLTSRGKPKAALVSLEDYEWLARSSDVKAATWQTWLEHSDRLGEEILERRNNAPIDLDAIWQAARTELEARDARGD